MMDYEKLYPNENLGAKNGPRKYNRWFSVCYALTITLGSFQYGIYLHLSNYSNTY